MSAVKAIMSLKNTVGASATIEALGEAGGDAAVKAIMSLKSTAGASAIVKALGRAGKGCNRVKS